MDLKGKTELARAMFGRTESPSAARRTSATAISDSADGKVTIRLADDESESLEADCLASVKSGETVTVLIEDGHATVLGSLGWGDTIQSQVDAATTQTQYFFHDASGAHVSTQPNSLDAPHTTITSTGMGVWSGAETDESNMILNIRAYNSWSTVYSAGQMNLCAGTYSDPQPVYLTVPPDFDNGVSSDYGIGISPRTMEGNSYVVAHVAADWCEVYGTTYQDGLPLGGYAQAHGGASTLSLAAGTITAVYLGPLTTGRNTHLGGEFGEPVALFERVNAGGTYGIRVNAACTLKVSAGMYYAMGDTNAQAQCGVYVKKGSSFSSAQEVASRLIAAPTSNTYAVNVGPVLVTASDGDVFFLGARVGRVAGTAYPSNNASYLLLEVVA